MSRRHHGRSRHHDRPRPDSTTAPSNGQPRAVDVGQTGPFPGPTSAATPPKPAGDDVTPGPNTGPIAQPAVNDAPARSATAPAGETAAPPVPTAPAVPDAGSTPVTTRPEATPSGDRRDTAPQGPGAQGRPGPVGQQPQMNQATAPQLRRFIKSRPYVPMHELRRRFAIDGGDDDVTPVHIDRHWIFVGLPEREGGLLGELLRAGEIGYELSLDPRSPIVVGVYPMRPAPRP